MKIKPSYLIAHSSYISSRGFTIIETLVAVAILMIAIAGPLVVASKGLTAALVAKDQMIAAYMAQETIETLKNIRDNNLSASPTPRSWDVGTGYVQDNMCTPNHPGCDINSIDGNVTYCPNNSCMIPIYYNNLTGYNHDTSGEKTKFNRYYYIKDYGSLNYTNKEVTIEVFVEWNEGTVPYQISLQSQMVIATR